MPGDADIAAVAEVIADRSRCRMLMALADGRALPAGRLATEAGIAASTTSAHLGRLVDAGMLVVEPHGRHRYYRLAGPDVGELIESIARVAPPMTVRSLREGTAAEALRRARTCYDHLAGRLGVALMEALLSESVLEGGDGRFDPARSNRDRLSAPGWDVAYVLSDKGEAQLQSFGIDCSSAGRRPLVRYCVDWSEQRHHLAGALGARMLNRFEELRWIERRPATRALTITDVGARDMGSCLGLDMTQVLRAQ
ncbi:MAG TPA: winged helix-turn-helix domain-containing protein [Acidimicrobiales bacterium]